MKVELKQRDDRLLKEEPFLEDGSINTKLIEKVEKKEVYTKRDGEYFYPLSALEHIKHNFNNCTIYEQHQGYGTEDCLKVIPGIKCKKRYSHYSSAKIVHNGRVLAPDELCEHCRYMLEEYVGECNHRHFKPISGWEYKSNGNSGFVELKPGYLHAYNFDSDFHFDPNMVINRINEYRNRAKWNKHTRKIKEDFCENCYKYKTKSCKNGFSNGKNVLDCVETEEEVLLKTKREIIKEFGSMSDFFHMLLQCGQTVDYKDPKTNRTSQRVISVPVIKDGVKGFYMGWNRYPYDIDFYGEPLYYQREEDKKHENFISFYKLKKKYGKIKGRYKKGYDELLCCAYLFLSKASHPGRYICVNGHQNYMISLKLFKAHSLWKKKKSWMILESNTGDSTGSYPVHYDDLKELANKIRM